jgi:hypothetical protein
VFLAAARLRAARLLNRRLWLEMARLRSTRLCLAGTLLLRLGLARLRGT